MPRVRTSDRRPTSAAPSGRPAPARRRPPRRGIVCVVAMLFLVLFAVLAVGFYGATAMSAQVSANERTAYTSQIAAESGMQFIRYRLATLDIPSSVAPDKVLEEIYLELAAAMEGSGNLGTRLVGYDGTTVSIPEGADQYVRLSPGGAGFRVTLTDVSGERIRVKVTGSPGGARSSLCRAIEMEYVLANRPSTVFDYGVASKGQVQFKASAATKLLGTPDKSAGVLATFAGTPAISTGGGAVEGDLSVVGAKSQVSLGGGPVGGSSVASDILANHVHVVGAPEFPYVHTTVFKPFATNVYASGAAVQKNIRVPPNTNPKFNAGDVIEGILYIESPNAVTFRGHATINGVVVFENKNGIAQNSLDFRGNVSPAAIPDTPQYAALRARAAGLAIAAPTASVVMSGSVDGNVDGSIIAAKLSLDGSADLTLHNGSLITLGPDPTLVQGKIVNVVGNAADAAPYAGARFRAYFKPDTTSYRETTP